MSVFAIRVKVGDEPLIYERIVDYILHYQFDLITDVIMMSSFVDKLRENKKPERDPDLVVKGYLFVETKWNSQTIPAKVYQFLRSIPGVFQVLQYAIPKEEFRKFEKTCQFLEEGKVEIRVTAEEADKLKNEDTGQSLMDEINEHAKDTMGKTVEKCRAFLRRTKQVYRFSYSLFSEVWYEAKAEGFPKEKLFSGSFMFPRLIRKLREWESSPPTPTERSA